MTADAVATPRKGGGMHPPAKWVCPKCGTWVQTHVPTYPVECRRPEHAPKGVTMEPSND